MTLPAIDLGLMTEHLSAHKGLIHKLKMYEGKVFHPTLRYLLELNREMLKSHTEAMMAFIHPYYNGEVVIPPLPYLQLEEIHKSKETPYHDHDKSITMESKSSSKMMANENFMSASLMKDPNVRRAHLEMAHQQATLQQLYREFSDAMGWSAVSHTTIENQAEIYRHYYGMFSFFPD
ncbi:hypothetical protein KO561_16230 [Radiobacillus kanasensis]|uniref:hypothetical protein n=1 Tax=Radiobacillus kanasensis TaxID=2844358 RepID=UPI001E5DE926|nr:hypothetical protein [Radiobacillus kanasensis]UFT98726.1 hypothetical protein KO561_16230 [Radiobacillus kanasensis]